MQQQPRIPGFVNTHCHAFQRALRGRTEGGDFWAWRETMLELASGQTPEGVRRGYVDVYRELRAAGYTAVGEFHYLGLEEAQAAAEAAAEAGIELVLLHVAYARGGIDRFRLLAEAVDPSACVGDVEEYELDSRLRGRLGRRARLLEPEVVELPDRRIAGGA